MKDWLQVLALGDAYRTLRYRCGLTLYLAVLVLGSVPGARTEIGHLASGIVLHAVTYSIISFLLYSGCAVLDRGNAWRTAALVSMLGAVDEMIQVALPYRTGAISDWLVDSMAALLTVALMHARLHATAGQPSKMGR